MLKNIFLAFWLVLLVPAIGFSAANVPDCMDGQEVLPIDNERVLELKNNSANGTLKRAHVQGVINRLFSIRNDHIHFEIIIGKQKRDTLEVIYNRGFGPIPQPRLDMVVEVCGDYITSNARNGKYPPSPSGAIIHWIHKSDNPRHESGYLLIDGILGGQAIDHRFYRERRRPRHTRN